MDIEQIKSIIIEELKELEVESSNEIYSYSIDEYNKRLIGLNKLLSMIEDNINQFPNDPMFLYMKNRVNLANSIGMVNV